MQTFINNIKTQSIPRPLLYWGSLTVLAVLLAIVTEFYYLATLPAAVLMALWSVTDYRKVFYLLLFCIPLSTEFLFPNGFGTDLPTEPLMIGLMGIFIIQLAHRPQLIDRAFFYHPISFLILLHLVWIFLTTFWSDNLLVSVKYLLAKLWYAVVFYWLAGQLLKNKRALVTSFWCVLSALLLTLIVVNIRHAMYGFSFDTIFRVLDPFYRNHVAYACIMAVVFPFVVLAVYWYRKRPIVKWFLIFAALFIGVSIYLSYTRAAYLAVVLSGIWFVIMRYKKTLHSILLALGVAVVAIVYLADQNNYLEFAPDYDKTISHTEFDDLLAATYQLEDISLMERFYRWVGGFYMVQAQPLVGFGPGNFYNFYEPYTVSSFRTYVSENPEQSGIHNYYLMVAVEQGVPGLLIFLLLCVGTLLIAERAYHLCRHPLRKSFIAATTLSFFTILVVLIINDLIETDKVGTFFFLWLALLVRFDLEKGEMGFE
ncbi:MAG: O-antigen ligase family protein [Bacteroidota bacterium]